jgi:hypothetical protein
MGMPDAYRGVSAIQPIIEHVEAARTAFPAKV